MDGRDLLRRYAESRSDEAFGELVQRHVNLVYSVALREVGNPHQADEIAQAVFIILARKAAQLRHDKALSSWLFQTTRLTARNFLRREGRRRQREQEAYMESTLNEPAGDAGPELAHLLDPAVESLGDKDRRAILLRFYEGRNLREVGEALGASEPAAEMRVHRALEKLRKIFARRGVCLSLGAVAGIAAANSVHAAPAGLAANISAVAVTQGVTAGASTLTLVKGALKIMAWTKAKTAVIVSVTLLLATGMTTIVVQTTAHPSWADDPSHWDRLETVPAGVAVLRPTRFPNRVGGNFDGRRLLLKDYGFKGVVGSVFDVNVTRTLYPPDIPAEHFDLMLTLPQGSEEWFQAQLKSRFGLMARRETRNAEVLRLTVNNPNPPNLKQHISSDDHLLPFRESRNHKMTQRDVDLSGFFMDIENTMGQPVLPTADLHGQYDMDFDWQPHPGESDPEALRRALGEQLGLELVPTNMPVEMLVVEKAK